VFFSFVRSDQDDRRSVTVSFGERSGVTIAQVSLRPASLPEDLVLAVAFKSVEDFGGRAVREEWSSSGNSGWQANMSVVSAPQTPAFVRVDYLQSTTANAAPRIATFRYDIATRTVTRVA